MKAFFGIIPKTRSLLTVVAIVPLVLLLILYAQSRYGTSQESAARPPLSAPAETQNNQDKGARIRTLLVKRLLNKLDASEDISVQEKSELEKILREADRYLAEAAAKKSGGPGDQPSQNAGNESKEPASSGKQPAARTDAGKPAAMQEQTTAEKRSLSKETGEARTPVVRALLRLLDEVIEDEVADTTKRSQQKDELRESLLEADKLLRQYLGDSARARIEAANRKPSIPNVYNPRRKPASEPANH
ncbi:MAG: hypothetical protein ACUVQG_03575 [Thermogutta sp.]